jgi:hypothetical protein
MARTRETGASFSGREKVAKPISDVAPEVPELAAEGHQSRPLAWPASAAAGPTTAPTDDEIRTRAYRLYEERGRAEGFADEDWFVAERELRSRK